MSVSANCRSSSSTNSSARASSSSTTKSIPRTRGSWPRPKRTSRSLRQVGKTRHLQHLYRLLPARRSEANDDEERYRNDDARQRMVSKELRQACVGFFQIGGGIAGDFPICVVPMLQQDMEIDVPFWSYFCQITDTNESYGSYSGRTPRKRSPGASSTSTQPKFAINSDATIVAPLIFAYCVGAVAGEIVRRTSSLSKSRYTNDGLEARHTLHSNVFREHRTGFCDVVRAVDDDTAVGEERQRIAGDLPAEQKRLLLCSPRPAKSLRNHRASARRRCRSTAPRCAHRGPPLGCRVRRVATR